MIDLNQVATIINVKSQEYYEKLARKGPKPHYTTWCSEAGHPCLRYLIYRRTHWEQFQALPAYVQPRLETGIALHEKAKESFRNKGFQVYENPDALHDKELEISGYMDFEIACEELKAIGIKSIPVEAKSVEDWYIDKYKIIEDVLAGDYWVRKWAAQGGLYCWCRNKELGLIHLRSLKRERNIPFSILQGSVIDFVHELMENLKKVNEHIKKGTLPDRIKYEPSICKNCNAKHICLPDEPISDGQVIIDEKLEKKLIRRDELISFKKEYDQLDKELKEIFKNKNNVLVGNHIITGKPTKAGHWTTKIEKVENDEKPKE